MTPRSHLRAALLALAVVLAPPAVARPDREAEDALARYLDSRDLKSLLIDHLEGALSHASPDERPGVAERLSALYAEALERAPTADERTALERRARALLDTVPEAEGFDLRLNLHRASYARAEQAAERRRLLLATPEETEEAARSLRTLIVDLVQIGAAANKRVDALEKQEQGAGDLDSSLLRDALAAARRHRSLAMYLAGWSGTYLAELTSEGVVGDTKPGPAGAAPPGVLATESAKRFGWLLNAPPNAAPTIDRVPEASLRLEHVARAALGVGTCASIRGDYAEAVRWFDLVEHAADAPAQVRAEIFARRFVAAAHNAEWIDALRLLRQRRGVETPTGTAATPVNPLTPTEARLVAALSFKAQPPQRSATVVQKLREVALADLVARDELSQLLDLTNRFGTESLTGLGDAKGFIVAYIRGLQSFGRARDAHKKAAEESPAAVKPDDPTADRAVVALYEDAQALLKAAGTATDADKFGPARANAAMLLGMSAFYSATEPATAVAAAERFAAAATLAQSPAALADAAWMRVRALDLAADLSDKAAKDKQAKAGSAESRALADIVSRRDAARAEFLAKFPSDARAGTLLLRRSIAASKATADASTGGTGANSTGGAPSKPLPADANATIEALLKVAPDAPTYAASRREAARLLYIAARDAAEPARVAAVNRFAGVAEPLLAEDAAAAGPSSAETAVRAKVVARQLLDAYLSGPERLAQPQRARPVLETLAALESRGALSLDDCRSEILYRRLQVAAMLGEAAEADAVADALAALPAGSPAAAPDRFVVAGRRLLLSRAMTEWKRGPQSAPLARALVKHGERALAAAGNAAPDDATIAAQAAVAEAGAFLWTNEQDESAKALALKLLHAALAARPSSEPILRQAAQFAPLAGEATFGAECWKRLLAGAEIGAPKWFEATYGLASALKDSQPAAARDLLERCRALFPDFGPEPWGSKLRQLDEALRGGGEMSGFSPPELEGPLGPHDPFERPQIGARAGGESTRLFVGVLLGGLLVAMIVAGFLLSGRPPRTGITALPPAATPPSAPPPPPHETAAAPQQPTRITSGASRTEAPEESPAKPPDIEAIRASLNAAAQALAGMPEDARQPFEIAANLLAAQWPEMGRADFESLVGSLVSYVHAEANASGATAPPSIESIGAASRRLSPTSGQRLTATDLAQTVFACGMLARLAVESDLPLPARARVDSMLADANLARPLSAADAFWSAAATALRRAPAYIVARPATGAKGPSDTGPESVWRRWLAAVRAVSVVLPERRDDLLLAATRELMLTASAGPPDAASRSLMQSILADASWGPSPTPGGDATPARQGVLDLLDDARISSRELAGLTQWLVGSVPAAGLGVDCILRTDAGPADRAKARDRISSAWNIRPPGEADALRGRWIAEAKRDLAASPATPSPIDRLSRVATLARLCEAAACLRRGDAATAKSILDNPAGPVEAAKQSPAHSTPATLVSDPLRDGKWALRFLSARRSAAERRRAVAELGGSTAQLGPVDAETLLDAAVFGSPGDVRVAALRIAERHATEPAMVNALLEQFPRAPRNDAVAGLIARASLTALPPARDRSWPVAARRALVSRLLGQLSGASELAAVDRLAEVVGDAYAGWAGPMFAGPKSATAPADASADEKAAARAAAVDPGVAADRVRASLRAEIASFAASNPGQRDALLPALAAADRRHAARRSLAEGPVQEFEAGIVAVTDLLGLLAQAERPASAETVAKALGELWVARRGSDDVYEHLNACQETATRLWLLRLSPEDAASPPPAAKTKPPESLRKDVR